jgi:sensor histidine kinase YesM
MQREVAFVSQALQEERFRSERLEEQVNDLTELHQNEVENLKQTITDMEEKVQYQSEERLRDIHEMLECCQTKVRNI